MVKETIQHGEEVPEPDVEVMEGVEIVEYNVDKPLDDMRWEIAGDYPWWRLYYCRGMIIEINLYDDGAIESVNVYKSVDDFAKVERWRLSEDRPYSNLVLGTRSAPPFRLEVGRS
jgi:hypothetical protein